MGEGELVCREGLGDYQSLDLGILRASYSHEFHTENDKESGQSRNMIVPVEVMQ